MCRNLCLGKVKQTTEGNTQCLYAALREWDRFLILGSLVCFSVAASVAVDGLLPCALLPIQA